VIYFWIADGYLKAKSGHSAAHEPDGLEDKRESLMPDGTELSPTSRQYEAAPWSELAAGKQAAAAAAPGPTALV
jgi:hypothetical protein